MRVKHASTHVRINAASRKRRERAFAACSGAKPARPRRAGSAPSMTITTIIITIIYYYYYYYYYYSPHAAARNQRILAGQEALNP
jgi:hypothetical protein